MQTGIVTGIVQALYLNPTCQFMRSWQWKGYGMVHLAWYALLVLVNKQYRNLLQTVSVILNIHDFLVVLLCLPDYVVISEIWECIPMFSESMGGNNRFS